MAKISVNKLGEYLTATPSRRRAIVKEQQKDSTFIFGRYNDARNAISDYLTGVIQEAELQLRIDELANTSSESPFIAGDKKASADALEKFKDLVDDLDLRNTVIEKGTNFEEQSIDIAGVSIKARSDLILKDSKTEKICGFIKLHFSQTAPLNAVGAAYVGAIVKKTLEEKYGESAAIDPKKGFVIDIPSESIHETPKATKKLLKDVEAACEEIAARWSRE